MEDLIVQDDRAGRASFVGDGQERQRFDNRYCWIVYFRDAMIVRVRAYLDSAMVARLFEENPIA